MLEVDQGDWNMSTPLYYYSLSKSAGLGAMSSHDRLN